MVGQVDPWRIDDQGKPYFALLVSFETALEECKGWSNQDLTKTELSNYLKLNNILTLRNIDQLQKIKEDRKEEIKQEKETKKRKGRMFSEEEKKALSERMFQINLNRQSKKDSITKNPQVSV